MRTGFFILWALLVVSCSDDDKSEAGSDWEYGSSICLSLAETFCDICEFDDVIRDVPCGCIEDGEVRNGSKYFQTRKDAEEYCQRLLDAYEVENISDEELSTCAEHRDQFDTYGSEACEMLEGEAEVN